MQWAAEMSHLHTKREESLDGEGEEEEEGEGREKGGEENKGEEEEGEEAGEVYEAPGGDDARRALHAG